MPSDAEAKAFEADLQDFIEKLSEKMDEEDEDTDREPDKNAYYANSAENERDWQLKTRVVRLDVVIMALHLMSARVATKVLPALAQQVLKKGISWAESWIKGRLLKILSRELPVISWLVQAASELASAVNAEKTQRDTEKQIRALSLGLQKDLYNSFMPQSFNGRKVRDVHTRHLTRKKRRQQPYSSQ